MSGLLMIGQTLALIFPKWTASAEYERSIVNAVKQVIEAFGTIRIDDMVSMMV